MSPGEGRPPTPVFAANWKMHKGPAETREYVERFAELYAARADRTTVFFPPSISLPAFRRAAAARKDLELGVQDVHEERSGPHTGAISAGMAAGAEATWALAGHSERRREFGDTDEQVALKVGRILEVGLRPVLCVGETLEEREAGQLEEVLRRQLRAVLQTLEPGDRNGLVYAYEPVWAIGTGRTARPEDAAEAHGLLWREIVAQLPPGRDEPTPVVLYGGSVKPANIGELLAAPRVDGVLVGGASLEPESFAEICSASG